MSSRIQLSSSGFARTLGQGLVICTLATTLAILVAQVRSDSAAMNSPASEDQHHGAWHVATVAQFLDAIANMPRSGGTIFLDSGSYIIHRTIEIRAKNFVNIVGTGWDTQIVCVAAMVTHLKFIDASFCTVRNLLLQADESATAGSAICYQGQCSSGTINSCRIVNFCAERRVLRG